MNPILFSTPPTQPTGILVAIKQSFVDMGISIGLFLPKLAIAVIILSIGILVAKIIRTLLTKTLEGIKFDEILEKVGIRAVFNKMGLVESPSIGIPKIIHFFILVMIIRVASVSAGFSEIANIVDLALAFLPKLSIAFIIMIAGFLVSEVIQKAVFNALDAKGLDYAPTLSNICFGFIFVIFLTVALSQIGIETELLKDSVKIILAGVSIAIALTLGLGLKTHAKNIVAAVYVRDIYRKGTEITINNEQYNVKGVGPVTTKLENTAGEFLILPNCHLISNHIKGTTNS